MQHARLHIYTLVLGLLCTSSLATATPYRAVDPLTLASELQSMEALVDMRFTPEVQMQVDKYLVRNPQLTQRIADRAMRHFPLISSLLEAHDMPQSLKYLVIVESGINPEARSRAGATGLWQFMAPTARDYKLRMYHSVDERMDPYRSTEAALQYMRYLYDRFGDWALVMAAYNTGPNRLARLMEEHGTTDYWALRPHLPEETANYVPYYIAASYVFSQMSLHGIAPERPDPDLFFTDRITIYDHKLYIGDVAELLHVDKDVLYALNPLYKKNYIPKSENGYGLTIPRRAMSWAREMLDTLGRTERIILRELVDDELYGHPFPDSLHDDYAQIDFILQDSMSIEEAAELLYTDAHQLAMWNQFATSDLLPGTLVAIALPIVGGQFRMVDYVSVQPFLPVRKRTSYVDYDPVSTICIDGQAHVDAQRKCYLVEQVHKPVYLRKGISMLSLIPETDPAPYREQHTFIIGADVAR